MKRLTLILLLTLPMTVAAQIYKTTDSQGNVVFTDKPSSAGKPVEEVKLHTTNTAPPPPDIPRPASAAAASDTEESEQSSYTVGIASPANETTIPMGPGNFLLSATVEPSLASGEMLQLHMDGIPWGEPQASASWGLTNIFRGGHDFTVSVLGTDGAPLVSSTPVRIYVMRPSINNKNRN
ncbi:MAG: DUF4124 domain-containing protein [Halioglobus sp.]